MEGGENMNKNILEAIKEGIRLALFGAVAYLVTYLLQVFGTADQSDTNIAIITLVLRVADKYLHKSGVAEKGLSRI